MGETAQINRRESFGLSQGDFKTQEELALKLISWGTNHAWGMKEYTDYYGFRIPITSFRRALTDLEKEGIIEECKEKIYWESTKRHVTSYRIVTKELSLFNQ